MGRTPAQWLSPRRNPPSPRRRNRLHRPPLGDIFNSLLDRVAAMQEAIGPSFTVWFAQGDDSTHRAAWTKAEKEGDATPWQRGRLSNVSAKCAAASGRCHPRQGGYINVNLILRSYIRGRPEIGSISLMRLKLKRRRLSAKTRSQNFPNREVRS